MKKKLALAAFAAVAVSVMAMPSWAFVSVKITTVTAGVSVGGQKIADFTLAIKDAANPFGATKSSVTWSGVNPLVTTWKLADQLFVINSTVTDSGGGIKIYTDNTFNDGNSATPQFVDPTPLDADDLDSLAAGLLLKVSTTSTPPLPMAWSVKTSTRIIEGGNDQNGIGAADPNNGPSGPVFNNKFQWLFYTDKSNWDGIDVNNDGDYVDPGENLPLALDAKFVTMINSIGTHFGQADTEFGAHPDGQNSFVYLEANFATAQVLTAYETAMMRVEAFLQ